MKEGRSGITEMERQDGRWLKARGTWIKGNGLNSAVRLVR